MAKSLNQVVLMGNLVRDPELRQTPTGQNVCSVTLALNSSFKGKDGNWQEKTDYIDVVIWSALGERVAQWLTKGSPAIVTGKLQTRQWEQDGQKRSKVEVVASDVVFVKGDKQSTQAAKPQQTKASFGQDEPINLNDIPFQ